MIDKPSNFGIIDHHKEGFCSKCGYPEEAHYNRGFTYQAKPDSQGVYHWKPCKKYKKADLK